MPLKYEYLTITHTQDTITHTPERQAVLNAFALDKILNAQAQDGWWLFAIYPDNNGTERIVFERILDRHDRAPDKNRVLN